MQLKYPLLPYQEEAANKLTALTVGALYMEPGTGKTITAIEIARRRYISGKIEHILWLCPCSVKQDMMLGIKKVAPSDLLSHITICGIETLSSSIRTTSYLLRLVEKYKCFLVVDESLLIKNPRAYRTKNILRLSQLCKYKIILNGTPISKNEADLYAQWLVLDWQILGYSSYWQFAHNHLEYDDYGNIRRVLNIDYLASKIEPYTFTIRKTDVLNLPEKNYYTAGFNLTSRQSEEYELVKEILLSDVNEFDSTTIYRLFTGLQRITSGRRIVKTHPLRSIPMFPDPMDNPRIQTLIELLEPNEKTIIWCKYEDEILDIKKILTSLYGNDSVALFYGRVPSKKRNIELLKFKASANWLLAVKTCGGFALNLQFCNNMIYYNNDFDWASREQSEDRCHRIGQEKNVKITDICAWSKVDIRILKSLQRKENLSNALKSKLAIDQKLLSAWLDGVDI